MDTELLSEQLFAHLIGGNRPQARALVDETLADGGCAEELAQDVLWPVAEMINSLYRADQLTNLAQHYATRLLRSLVDQIQARYERRPSRGRRILMFCGTTEAAELEAQLAADLAEADGYEVLFGGGDIKGKVVHEEVMQRRPDVLLMFASSATDLPIIRQLIDAFHDDGMDENLQVVVGGGVFNRADGLAEEIGADLWVKGPRELLGKLLEHHDRRATPEQRTVGRSRRAPRTGVA